MNNADLMRSTMTKLMLVMALAAVGFGSALAGTLEPPGPPAPTMVTLQEISRWIQSRGGSGVVVAKSGQTGCWDASGIPVPCTGTGQDGEYQYGISVSPRFTDNANGTVKDHLTGLIWLKDANCFGGRNWATALSDANALSDGACGLTDGSLDGDWRLPNARELESLIDYQQNTAPVLPTGHPFTGAQMQYWTSMTDAQVLGFAWQVNFGTGAVSVGNKVLMLFVWPVRVGSLGSGEAQAGDLEPPGPPAPTMVTLQEIHGLIQSHGGNPSAMPKTGQTGCWDASGIPVPCTGTGQDGEHRYGVSVSPRFTDNANGTVKDHLTGLIWLKDADCFGLRNWTDALTDANTLSDGACGLTDGSLGGDWRLPNVRELQSLTDYGNFTPPLPTGHPFSGVQSSGYYWSSTSTGASPGNARRMNLLIGRPDSSLKTIVSSYVWPVRGGP